MAYENHSRGFGLEGLDKVRVNRVEKGDRAAYMIRAAKIKG